MALGSYGTALGWLGSETGKSSIRVFFDYNQLCTSKVELASCVADTRAKCVSEHDGSLHTTGVSTEKSCHRQQVNTKLG